MKKESTASILKESKKQKQKKRLLWILPLIVIFCVGIGYSFFSSSSENTQESSAPTIVSPTRGDLSNSIESDGTIINPNIVDLSFLINGTLENIYVEEGDRVEAGQDLAELDTRDLEFNLRSAQSSLQIAYANYEAKSAMLTDTQLRELEISLTSQQDEVNSITLDVGQDLQQVLDLGLIEIETAFPALESTLEFADSFLLIDSYSSSESSVWGASNNSVGDSSARDSYRTLVQELQNLSEEYQTKERLEDADITNYLRRIRTFTQSVQDLIDLMIDVLKTAVPNNNVSQSQIDSELGNLVSKNNNTLSDINSLTSAIQKIESAYLTQQNKIVTAENAITKLESQIETAKESVEEKEISKKTSLSVLSAQITQAKIKVEQAQYNLDLAKLVAPISGEIIEVNGNEGETIKTESTSADTAFIKVLSDSNFTTEVYVEEIDIAKIKKGQKVIITLDAIADMELEGTVTFISSTATTSNSGVVTYLVRVEITDTQEAPIKEGMTTYVEFLTEEATNAVLVPTEAITQRGEKSFVMLENGEKRLVEVGISDGSMTEIVSGLEETEKILVGGSVSTQTGKRGSGEGMPELSESMLERMEEAGLTEEEIAQVKAGEMTSEMREKLRSAGGGGMRRMGGGRPPQ